MGLHQRFAVASDDQSDGHVASQMLVACSKQGQCNIACRSTEQNVHLQVCSKRNENEDYNQEEVRFMPGFQCHRADLNLQLQLQRGLKMKLLRLLQGVNADPLSLPYQRQAASHT
eukprot:6283-Heterococcus_DN1.PRE.2